MKYIKNKNFIKFLLFVVFILAAIIISRNSGLADYYSPSMIRDSIESFGIYAPVVFILVYVIGTVLFFPGSILTIAGGVLFGSFLGTLYNFIGVVIGASLAFLFARYMGRGFVKDLLNNKFPKIKEYENKIFEQGFVAILILRLIPIFPFNALNLGLGLTKVKFSTYFFATIIGTLPGTVVYTYFGNSLAKLDTINIIIAGVLLVLLFLIYPIYKYYKKKRHDL
ncbi:hypothetical protein GF340_05985 [Candidatus Peregrinibacteria bacterium]|nr:hypothetical protein [Candidatus Peregrinibacteria bacterium]